MKVGVQGAASNLFLHGPRRTWRLPGVFVLDRVEFIQQRGEIGIGIRDRNIVDGARGLKDQCRLRVGEQSRDFRRLQLAEGEECGMADFKRWVDESVCKKRGEAAIARPSGFGAFKSGPVLGGRVAEDGIGGAVASNHFENDWSVRMEGDAYLEVATDDPSY